MEKSIYRQLDLTFDEYVGRKIRDARTTKKVSISTMAANLGASNMWLSKVERGIIPLKVTRFFKIAQLLNKPLNYFID